MDDSASLRFERFFTRAALILSAAVVLYFVITEFGGFVRLVNWLGDAVAALPNALGDIATHFTVLNTTQLFVPMLIGAGVGIVGTLYVLRPAPLWTVGAGGVLGIISAQILTTTLQHCTYAPEAPTVEALLGGVITALSSLILLLPFWVWRRSVTTPTQALIGSGVFKRPLLAWGLLAPTLVSLLIFLYYPSFQTLTLSLNSRRFPLPQERFVCLGNYISLTGDAPYATSFGVTLFITLMIVLFSLAASLGIAVLASQKIRGASIYRTLLIWPFALSPVVTGVIFLALFREGGSGLINYLLDSLFGSSPSWLRDPALARWVIVAAAVWNILGFNVLFYIAGLQNVPHDLLEAAQIDGANRVQRFARVTFPLLSPFTFFLLVTNVTYSFYGIYGAVDALTQGGPPIGPAGQFGGATNVLIYKLYEDAFTPGAPIGLAAAQAVILFLCVAALTVLQFRFVESRVNYAD